MQLYLKITFEALVFLTCKLIVKPTENNAWITNNSEIMNVGAKRKPVCPFLRWNDLWLRLSEDEDESVNRTPNFMLQRVLKH